jgi:hypothetical protein
VDIAAMEVLIEQVGGVFRDRRERRASIGIEATFKRGQQAVIGTPMKASKQAGQPRIGRPFRPGEFLQPAEHGVNDDDIRTQTIDSGRQGKV